MLRYMERSTIYYLKQKGWTNVQIAEFTGHHRDTIARVLREDVEKKPNTRNRSSAVAVFDCLFYHDRWGAVGGGHGQYDNGGVGSKRRAGAGLESGLPEAGGGVQISSGGLRSSFGEPERSRREPGQICEGELHCGTHLS